MVHANAKEKRAMKDSHKPSHEEDTFFAREEIEKLRKLHAEKQAARSASERTAEKALHHMRCPKCGAPLTQVAHRGVNVDRCFGCNGVWLDEGELEQLAGKDSHIVAGILHFLFHK